MLSTSKIPSTRKILVAVASAALVLGLSAAPVRIAGFFGPQSAAAACANFWGYEFANKAGKSANLGCVDISNLKNKTTNLAPLQPCDGQLFTSYGTWNDCPSSVSFNLSAPTEVCLHTDANYSGNVLKVLPGIGWGNLAAPFDNAVSSVEFATSNCFVAGNQT